MADSVDKNMFPIPNNSTIVVGSIPVLILCHTKAATIAPRMCIQSSADNDHDDALEIIFGASESKVIYGWVLYNEANIATLSANNLNPTKDSTFATGDFVWVAQRVPVLEAILTTGQGTIVPGKKLVCAGEGKLKTHPEGLTIVGVTTAATTYYLNTSAPLTGTPLDPTIAIAMGRYVTANATQIIQIAPLW